MQFFSILARDQCVHWATAADPMQTQYDDCAITYVNSEIYSGADYRQIQGGGGS